jgi:hypothetical protein
MFPPKYSRPSSSETNKGKGYKQENLVFSPEFFRKPRLSFDICATAVMGIKRLAIQLDPVETSSRCCVYSPGDVISGSVTIFGKRNVNVNGNSPHFL